MKQVNVHAAKRRLSALLEEVAAGREIIIAKAGKPVARLIPCASAKPLGFGAYKGKIKIHDDFDAPLPEEHLEAFGQK